MARVLSFGRPGPLPAAWPAVAVALAAAVFMGGPVAGAEAAPKCKHQPHELARLGGGVLFTRGAVLYGCTAYYGDPPVTHRLGPWGPTSKASFGGSTVVWTIRTTLAGGGKSDRVWVSDAARGGAWLRGVRPIYGPAAAADVRVGRLLAIGDAAAWVTTYGTVVLAVPRPDVAPVAIGSGTPGAAGGGPIGAGVPALVAAQPQGLATPPQRFGHRVVVGRWAALAGTTLAGTLKLRTVGSDGDECGGVTDYAATVRPQASQPPVGAQWETDWTSTNRACN